MFTSLSNQLLSKQTSFLQSYLPSDKIILHSWGTGLFGVIPAAKCIGGCSDRLNTRLHKILHNASLSSYHHSIWLLVGICHLSCLCNVIVLLHHHERLLVNMFSFLTCTTSSSNGTLLRQNHWVTMCCVHLIIILCFIVTLNHNSENSICHTSFSPEWQ